MPRYLRFEKKKSCNEWIVKNKKGQFLGDIALHEKWKRYAFYPDEGASEHDLYFCPMCLREIADYMDKLPL